MKKSILIADDEEAIRESILMVLEDEGFNCTVASDGEETIKQACAHPFDLIIMDLLMPRLKGHQLIKKVNECCPHTPILILSSYYDAEMAAYAIISGATQYMLKPVDFEDLVVTVHEILSKAIGS